MASHKYAKVVKRTDTPGADYHIQALQPDGTYKTIGKSNTRTTANMSAGIHSSNEAKRRKR